MSMSRTEIIDKIKEILVYADPAGADKYVDIKEDADFRTEYGMTSVNMLYIVIAIEETFGIQFDNIGMNDVATLRDVVNYIEAKLS